MPLIKGFFLVGFKARYHSGKFRLSVPFLFGQKSFRTVLPANPGDLLVGIEPRIITGILQSG